MKKIIATVQVGHILSKAVELDFDEIVRQGKKMIGVLDKEHITVEEFEIKNTLKCSENVFCAENNLVGQCVL